MCRIDFRLMGFQPPLPGFLALNCQWVDLLWAAITVGRRSWQHVVMHGRYSVYELVYRACLLFANLARSNGNYITRSDAYNALDPSEKGAVSYFMGLTLSKLFAEHVLNAPWMMHLDVYFNQLQPMIGNGKRRPDLVGQDSHGRWIVAESKGRTNGFDPNALVRQKQQTASIRPVAGQVPYLKFALVLALFGASENLAANCLDPEETDGEPSDLVIERDQFFDDYYEPFLNLVRDQPVLRTDVLSRIPELDMRSVSKRAHISLRGAKHTTSWFRTFQTCVRARQRLARNWKRRHCC